MGRTLLLIIATVCTVNVNGQWPLPQSFYDSMSQMNNNMQTMSMNMQAMGQRMASRREAIFNQNFELAKNGTDIGTGKIFFAADGGLGYAYSSPDGSYTMYVLGSGNPPSGSMYHNGPNGNRYNSW